MLGLCVVVWFVLQRTTFGFEVRTVGTNPNAARYAGMGVNRTIVLVMAVSGAFAGLAGAGEVTGTSGFLSPGVFVAIGFDAIAIALLARPTRSASSSPRSCGARCSSGAPLMQQETGLSIDAVRIIQALVLLFVAADVIVRTIFRLGEATTARSTRSSAPVGERRHDGERGPTRRAIPLGRRQTIGVLFGMLGVVLVGYVARNLEPRRQGPHLRAAAGSRPR